MAQLVGKKCNIMGMIEGQETEVLWDTGSQIALISEKWIRQRFKDTKEVKPLEDVLGYQVSIEAAGGSRIPCEGYVLLKFNCGKQEIMIPFLVTKADIPIPIIGYNVISMLMQKSN